MPEGLVRDPKIRIADGLIVDSAEPTRHPGVVKELPGRILLPGLVNAHSHAFQRAFRGHVQWLERAGDDFWSWRAAMYDVANRLPPKGVEAVSRLAFLEMAEAGITEVGEFHYLHHQPDGSPYADPDELAKRVIAAARSVGIRITLLRVAYGAGGVGQALRAEQRRFGDSSAEQVLAAVERLQKEAGPTVRIGLAPHSVRAVPRAWLPELASFQGPVHVHVSEQPGENEAAMAAWSLSPTQVLEEAGLLNERLVAVHMTWPLPGDIGRLQASGAGVCACPWTELDLGDGVLPLEAHDLPLSLGTDSQARIDLLEEARGLEWFARGAAGRRNLMSPLGERSGLARRLLEVATAGGAQALCAPRPQIAPGARADLIALNLDRPAALGVPPLEAAAFSATADWVTDVWVGGEAIVEGGRHRDRDAVVAEARPWLWSPAS